MPDTFGFEDASVEAHRLEGEGFRRCTRQAVDARMEEEDRRERMQLRAADWQDSDMVTRLRLM
jgi:hypothetical protein